MRNNLFSNYRIWGRPINILFGISDSIFHQEMLQALFNAWYKFRKPVK